MSCMLIIAVLWYGGEQWLRWRWVIRSLGQIRHKFLGEEMNQGAHGQARWGVRGSKGLVETRVWRVWRSKSAHSLLQWANHGVRLGEKLWDAKVLPLSTLAGGGCCDGGWERWDPYCQSGKVCGHGSQRHCGQACMACRQPLCGQKCMWNCSHFLRGGWKCWISVAPFLPALPQDCQKCSPSLFPRWLGSQCFYR